MHTVLLVETDTITRYCWREALQKRGYKVVDAQDPSEACLVARFHSETLNVLIVEVLFTDLTAGKLACEMKKAYPNLCVIASSTLPSEDMPSDLLYDAVLNKPVVPKQMLAIVDRLLQGEKKTSNPKLT